MRLRAGEKSWIVRSAAEAQPGDRTMNSAFGGRTRDDGTILTLMRGRGPGDRSATATEKIINLNSIVT